MAKFNVLPFPIGPVGMVSRRLLFDRLTILDVIMCGRNPLVHLEILLRNAFHVLFSERLSAGNARVL